MSKIITIDLVERSYDIYLGSGILQRITDFVPYDVSGQQVFLIYDHNLEWAVQDIRKTLQAAGVRSLEIFKLESGESNKSFARSEEIISWMLKNKITRKALVVALGGGVTGDLAGFCASIVLRGVSFIQVPTTLLAQVDSSVGGKTGINTAQGKNLVGSFYQPASVVIDFETLKTLPKREILAGYAEIAKYALIGDSGFFNWLEQNGEAVCGLEKEALIYAVEKSVKSKADIVQADEREESGQRALLNLGHTFGHALEAAAGYDSRLLHGEAVAIGMIMAFELSCRMGLCPRADVQRVEDHLMRLGLPVNVASITPALKVKPSDLLEFMKGDKKNVSGQMSFILVNGIGEAFLSSNMVSESLVLSVLKDSFGAQAKTTHASAAAEFKKKGIKGLWKSAFTLQS